MRKIEAAEYTADRAWGSELLADFGQSTVRLHWTDEPYHWHRNTGDEVFVVMDGSVDMHVREGGNERIIRLERGDGMVFSDGDEHVAYPVGEARILVVERKDSE